jgi:plastocyanin
MVRSPFGRPAALPSLIVAIAALWSGAATATTHVVTQSGFTFDPAALTIAVGDTVRWDWTGGNHTVTSGTSSTDPAVGALFDASLGAGNPNFSFIFTDPGVVPYFCRPHFGLGMTGTITVEAASAVGDTPPTSAPALLRNAPNPFNPLTEIVFRLPETAKVNLAVYDLAGRLVRNLVAGEEIEAGVHRRIWDGRDGAGRNASAGTYLYMLESGPHRSARTMVLVK